MEFHAAQSWDAETLVAADDLQNKKGEGVKQMIALILW